MKFTINEKEYDIEPFGFGTIRKLERIGISMADMDAMPVNVIVGVLSIACGLSMDEVCDELDSHVANGGSIDEVMDIVFKAFEESGFFPKANPPKKSAPKKKTTE